MFFSQTDIKFGVSIKNITGYLSGAAQIAEGAATKNPTAIISGVISVGDSVFKMLSHESAGAEQFTAKLKEVTKELEKQQTVIERSARTGYQNAALQQEIELLKKQKDLNDAAIKAEYGKTGHFLGISWDATSYVKIEQITAENDAISKQIADSQQQLDDLKLGNITQNTLADSIAQAFNDGKTSVDDFATYMNKVLLDAALNIFKAQYLLPAINDQLMPVITAALADNVLSKDEKANIDAVTKGIADKNKGIWDGLTGALGLGATTRTASSSGLASMSQDTGNELNGRFTAIQGHTFNINEGMKILQSNSQQALQHLAGIETNTARLEAIQNGIDTINLKGIILKK